MTDAGALSPPVVLDASVLFSIRATNLILEAATHHLFRPHWTPDIHAEWTRAVLEKNPAADPARIAKRCRDMDAYFPDACINHHHPYIADLTLPDPEDCHVLAAAIACCAELIVTFDLRHFPDTALAPRYTRAIHPDDFLLSLLDQHSDAMVAALVRAKLTGFATALGGMTDQF